MHEGFNKIISG